MMKTKFLLLFATLISLPGVVGCTGLNGGSPGPAGEVYSYSYEIGFTNNNGEHVAVSSLVVSGNGSHKGTPGIFLGEKQVLPFVDSGPCAAGSPCWTGTVNVPIDGKHEFTIEATVKATPAEWRVLQDVGGSHNLYCQITLDGKVVSLLNNTGEGYMITPVQDSREHTVRCSAHN